MSLISHYAPEAYGRGFSWGRYRFRDDHPEGREGLGMAGHSDSLGSPWIPHAIRPCYALKIPFSRQIFLTIKDLKYGLPVHEFALRVTLAGGCHD
jgi:hypothetical protein